VSILASSQRRSNTHRPLPPADLVKTLGGEILSLNGFVSPVIESFGRALLPSLNGTRQRGRFLPNRFDPKRV
jgi:hypothetical protein